jgi:hypothetical protein
LCFPLNDFTRENWHSTSFSTNVAESAHAYAQRFGKSLSLLGAVQQSERIDSQFFNTRKAVTQLGVSAGYGNRSITGRVKKNIQRQQGRAAKTKKASEKANGSEGQNAISSEQVEGIIKNFVQSDGFSAMFQERKADD